MHFIHYTNKHIPPGYLRVGVATAPVAKQGGRKLEMVLIDKLTG